MARKKRLEEDAKRAIRMLLTRAREAQEKGLEEVEHACLASIKAYQRKYHVRLTPRDKLAYCPHCLRVYPPNAKRRVFTGAKGLTIRTICPFCHAKRDVLIEKKRMKKA